MESLGHKWGEWTVTTPATTSSKGKLSCECLNCGKPKTQTIPMITSDTSAYASELLSLVNAERANKGLRALTVNSTLTEYANTRSQKLAVDWDLDNPQEYIRTVLMKSYGVTDAGENYGGGQQTPEAVMTKWMNDSKTCNRILNSNYKYIGVSCYKSGSTLYWVVDFAG